LGRWQWQWQWQWGWGALLDLCVAQPTTTGPAGRDWWRRAPKGAGLRSFSWTPGRHLLIGASIDHLAPLPLDRCGRPQPATDSVSSCQVFSASPLLFDDVPPVLICTEISSFPPLEKCTSLLTFNCLLSISQLQLKEPKEQICEQVLKSHPTRKRAR
jgi:hypothetical protein